MPIDWGTVWGLTVSPLELMVRGSAMYLFLFLTFRFLLRRDTGSLGIPDVLLLVIIADAAQNALAGAYQSITDGIVLVSTIIGWNLLIDWLIFRFAVVRTLLQPPALPLIKRGYIIRANLARERMSDEELDAKLREQGVEHLNEVKAAYMEADGSVSVIKFKGDKR